MEFTLTNNPIDVKSDNETLLRTIDKRIDDMEAGREFPLYEAFEIITELRNVRRNARA